MSSENSDSFTSSFLIWMPFISFSCLIALSRTANTMLNKSYGYGCPCLILDLRQKELFCMFSLLSMKLTVGLSYMAFLYWDIFPLYLLCWELLLQMDIQLCQMFFCINWDDNVIFIFHSINVVNHSCICGINPSQSWCLMFLMYCWIQFANILFRIFASTFLRDIGLWFSFLVESLFGFGIRIIMAS